MRLNHFSTFKIGVNHDQSSDYFDQKLNQEIFEKVAKKCYLPTNKILFELIKKYDGKFRVSFSLTGTFIEYCER
jgi:alpha-amylase